MLFLRSSVTVKPEIPISALLLATAAMIESNGIFWISSFRFSSFAICFAISISMPA